MSIFQLNIIAYKFGYFSLNINNLNEWIKINNIKEVYKNKSHN